MSSDNTVEGVRGREWKTIDLIKVIQQSGRVSIDSTVDVSKLPGAVRNYLCTVARDLEVEFQDIMGKDDVNRYDTIQRKHHIFRDKIALEASAPFDGERAEAETTFKIAKGYEARFHRQLQKQREKWGDWEPPKEVDPEELDYTVW